MPDSFPCMFHVTDTSGRIVQVSDQWLATLGYDREEVVGSRNAAFLAEDCAASAQARMSDILREGRKDDLVCEFVSKAGKVVPFRLSVEPVAEEGGQPLGVVAVLTPVEVGSDVVEELGRKSYRLQSCLEATEAGIWEWNVQTGESSVNERWAAMLGYRLEDLQPISAETWRAFAHPDDLQRSMDALQRHWDGETESYDVEARMRHRDGHWVWVHDRGRVFTRTPDGEPEWMFGTHFSLDEQRQRARNAERMERLLNRTGLAAGIGGWELDLETNELLWTDETRRIHGVDRAYRPDVAKALDFYAPEAREQVGQAVDRALSHGTPWDLELPFVRATGERIWVRAIGEVELRDGRARSLFGAFQDITDRRREHEELRRARETAQQAEQRLWAAVEAVPDAFALFDSEDRAVMFNQKYRDLYAASGDVVAVGQTFEAILREGLRHGQYPEAIGREQAWLEERLERHRNPSGPVAQELPGDRHVMVHEARLPNGDTVGFRVDVTELRRQERELKVRAEALEAAALTDPLTGLLNRRGLESYRQGFASVPDESFGVIHLDLDRFKPINDVFGHAAGDHLLRHVADILRSSVRGGDGVARVGGDEFVVVLRGPCTETLARRIASRIIARCQDAVLWQDRILHYGVSAGIAVGPAAELARLQEDADIALYEAKRSGRNRSHVFGEPLRERIEARKTLSDDLLEGLERGEIIAHYQPQVCARTGDIVGAEALARWEHPTRGLLGPRDFLALADDLGQTGRIDRTVYLHAIETGRAFSQGGTPLPGISINFSLKRLAEAGDLPWFENASALPFRMNLEILETLDVDGDFDGIEGLMAHVRKKGIAIVIDDFGSGRASLTSLLRFRPERVKLDGEITRAAVSESTGARAMVLAIGDMCRRLGIAMTAEGVETREQADLMRELGCDRLQGFHFGPPMSRDDLRAVLAVRKAASAREAP
ncbi:sensor domain-containing protein [Wenxinia saemankumensis]|uniref:PAS domain S-box-containing protein/diguanylate cyclase (GGDEF) domain-containing protein n=1 Tax=Wenxinia saemankumensis TaxID=1447782 RepID=A0A1M6AFC0_9RHOB|nr:EAL domain-containing protein [Wenxinia saemankumensis]SHI35244.1 PAS domain S-box-containing protein/diguanylate cyclase (GGDEF) domain-containing protein [Wenxinia saemankumensis]